MAVKSLVLVRHGESTWNVGRRMQGHADPPLTDTGIAQVALLARRIEKGSIDAIVSSDLTRAADTAREIASQLGLEVVIQNAWREHDKGEWTGLTRDEIKAQWPEEYARYRAGDQTMSPGGGESRAQFKMRVLTARLDLDNQFPGARVLLVTHRGVIRILAPAANPGHAEPVISEI